MNDNGETSTVLNRVQDELAKLRREQRHRNYCTSLFIVFAMATLFSGSGGESNFTQNSLFVLMFAGVVDLMSIRRSIRMMESIAAMFPKRISGSEQSAV